MGGGGSVDVSRDGVQSYRGSSSTGDLGGVVVRVERLSGEGVGLHVWRNSEGKTVRTPR